MKYRAVLKHEAPNEEQRDATEEEIQRLRDLVGSDWEQEMDSLEDLMDTCEEIAETIPDECTEFEHLTLQFVDEDGDNAEESIYLGPI